MAMSSVYSRLVQDMWLRDKQISSIESLMTLHEAPKRPQDVRSRSPKGERCISRMTYEEEKYEREMLNIRNFGYHWLKPIGISKTMGQVEDEAREIHESYEEYEGEDGDFNQNNPEILAGGLDGQEAPQGEEQTRSEAGEVELDEDIEDGASFEVGDASFTSSAAPITPAQIASGLYTTINGIPYIQRADGSLVPAQPPQLMSYPGTSTSRQSDNQHVADIDEEGLSSAEEGSIGGYSTGSGDTELDLS